MEVGPPSCRQGERQGVRELVLPRSRRGKVPLGQDQSRLDQGGQAAQHLAPCRAGAQGCPQGAVRAWNAQGQQASHGGGCLVGRVGV